MTPRLWPLPYISLLRLGQRDTQIVQPLAAPAERHPIGLNVRQDVDYAKVLAYVKQQGGVKAILFHCDTGVLPRLKDFLPYADKVIWRPRMFADETLYTLAQPAQWVFDRRQEMHAAGFRDGDLWLHLHNEAGWSVPMIVWEYSAMEYGLPYGVRFVALNCAVGTPPQEEIGLAHQVMALAGQFPDSIRLGLHEYFSVYGTRKDPWYLERWRWWEGYRKSKQLPPVKYLITEFGAEDIADDHAYTDALPRPFWLDSNQRIGAVATLEPAWAATYNNPEHNQNPKPYPGLDRAYQEQIVQAFSVGNYDEPEIDGVLLFGWGRGESRWINYDISGMTVLHGLLATWGDAYRATVPTDIPLEPTPEENPMRLYTPALVRTINGADKGVNVRRAKDATSEYLLTLLTGMEIEYAVSEAGVAYKSLGDRWIPVRTAAGVEGFVFAYYVAFDPRPPVVLPPDPVPEPEPDPDDTTPLPTVKYVTEAELADALVDLEVDLRAEFHTEMTALYVDLLELIAEVALKQGAGYAEVNRFLADKLESLKEAV